MDLSFAIIFLILNIFSANSQNLRNYLNDFSSRNSPLNWFTFGSDENKPKADTNNNVAENPNPANFYYQKSDTSKIYYDQASYNNNPQPQQPQYYNDPSNGCGQYFSYRNDFTRTTFGLASIPNPDRQRNVVKIILTVATRLASGDYGGIYLFSSKEDSLYAVEQGLPLQLKVRFPIQSPLPKIHQIYMNDRLLCATPKEISTYVTTLSLFFTFTTNLSPDFNINLNKRPEAPLPTISLNYPPRTQQPPTQAFTYYETTYRPIPQTTRTYITYQRIPVTTEETSPRPNIESHWNSDAYVNDVCGVSNFKEPVGAGLVKGGHVVGRGQFPWLVAYFYNSKYTNEFICGGSLISQKLVVTAAHCIQNKDDAEIRRPEASTFYFGKNNLDALIGEKGYVLSTALYLYVHPNWDSGEVLFSNDIAIAVLQRAVVFSFYVKPICIWRKTQSYEDMVQKDGAVAGWGKTDFESISTSTAMLVKLPVVTNEECLRSDGRFFKILSDKSFCAGYQNMNKGPCSGDSGGAFIHEEDGKSYLRGVISSAIFDESGVTCDNNKYAVFTDVSKYTDWIDGFMNRYG